MHEFARVATDVLTWFVIWFGAVYLVCSSGIVSMLRILLLRIANNSPPSLTFVTGLIYCPACVGFWVGLACTRLLPFVPHGAPAWILSGFAGMLLGFVLDHHYEIRKPSKGIYLELLAGGVKASFAQLISGLNAKKHDPDTLFDMVSHGLAGETPILQDVETMHYHATYLWQLLDDIDTLDDAAKEDDAAFRKRAYELCRMRFESADSDGYSLEWKPRDKSPIITPSPDPE